MNYLYDTNILIYIIKEHPAAATLENELNANSPTNLRIISIVSKAEMESIALQRNWGAKKIEILQSLLNQFLIVPIDSEQIIKEYAEIDAFSQGKHPSKKSNLSSRNMGKNDLWIAATASVTGSVLVTADGDFDHLNKSFFPVKRLKF